MKQQIRIIGGQLRGRKINFPDCEGLRPTPDRVRETLFNWLMPTIRGSRCLDLFAGSGALGFEAYSRGAAEVFLVEQNHKVYQALSQTILEIKTDKIKALHADAQCFIENCQEIFDIIFLDPPFNKDFLDAAIDEIGHRPCIKPGGLLYIESEKPMQLDAKIWLEKKSKKAGMVFYALYEKLPTH